MLIRTLKDTPEKIVHQIPKSYVIVRKINPYLIRPIARRYWIGILIDENEVNYIVQTYGYCEDCSQSVFAKFTPKFMKGPKGKLP